MTLNARDRSTLATTPATFGPKDFSTGNLSRLKSALRDALIKEGLFRDEADALLNTWELSYFKSPGLRIFYMVPQPWTDAVLPLRITGQEKITRAMVGRIELITPGQRALLKRISGLSVETIEKEITEIRTAIYRSTTSNKLFLGEQTLAAANVKVPQSYQWYLDLGRFRNTLILEEQQVRPSKALERFITLYGLDAYHVTTP